MIFLRKTEVPEEDLVLLKCFPGDRYIEI